MYKTILICTTVLAAFIFFGCDEDTNPAGSDNTTDTISYRSVIYDSSMAMSPNYQGTTFRYNIISNGNFTLESNIGYGYGEVETGTYTQTGESISFTPVKNTSYGAGGVKTDVTPVRTPYGGTITDSTLSLSSFIKIGDTKDLGEYNGTIQ